MQKLTFGDEDLIKLRKSRKKKEKQNELPLDISNSVNAIDFKLCDNCSKTRKHGYLNISTIFPYLCTECRDRFMQIANKQMIIGGLVNIQ